MKKIILFLFLALLTFSCYAQEQNSFDREKQDAAEVSFDEDKEDEPDEIDEIGEEKIKIKKHSGVKPKQAHESMKNKALQGLEANKEKFNIRKEEELKLLKYEYGFLEYVN